MSQEKKKIREDFRNSCFKRDKYSCVMCKLKSSPKTVLQDLDCHHITDRTKIINQGYCSYNGISLCKNGKDNCHEKAEQFWSTGIAYPGYSVEELYAAIGSSYQMAIDASKKL